jgi:hypothetical protein
MAVQKKHTTKKFLPSILKEELHNNFLGFYMNYSVTVSQFSVFTCLIHQFF